MGSIGASGIAPRIEKPLDKRPGVWGWWLDLTAPPRLAGDAPLAERERIRKAELNSYSILGILLFLLVLLSQGLTAQISNGIAVLVMVVGLVLAALCNRAGLTRAAAYLILGFSMATLAASVLTVGGLVMVVLPSYDLFTIPIFLSSLIVDRRAPWALAAVSIVFVLLDFSFQPHFVLNLPTVRHFDTVAYNTQVIGWWGMVSRHVALLGFAAFFGWLGARSVEQAITRADHAEELARLEEKYVQAETRRKEELNSFVREIIEAFVAQANGVERYLKLPADHPLAPSAHLLNQRLRRLRELRGEAGWGSGQLLAAARNLSQRLARIRAGTAPLGALHPSVFRTRVQPIDEIAGQTYLLLQRSLSAPAGSTSSQPLA